MTATPLILVVDDDEEITELLAGYLQRYRLRVCTAHDAAGLRERLTREAVDLVVLDWMLPGTDGLSLAREVRGRWCLPVIMLTARSTHADRVVGLENGADDYLTKPFEPRELVARIQSVLRRCRQGTAPAAAPGGSATVIRFDGWQLHRLERQLTTPEGRVVALTHSEYRLLEAFLGHPRSLLSRDQLLDAARGQASDQLDRSVDLLVSRLRQKLASDRAVIQTVRGAGYRFNARHVEAGPRWQAG